MKCQVAAKRFRRNLQNRKSEDYKSTAQRRAVDTDTHPTREAATDLFKVVCPSCGSTGIYRPGFNLKKQYYACRICGHQWAELYIAREKLSSQGARTDLGTNVPKFTWAQYCEEIGGHNANK